MRITVQRLAVLCLCAVGIGSWVVSASVASAPRLAGLGMGIEPLAPRGMMSLASPFVLPSAPAFERAGADAASRTAFRGLGRAAAVALAERDFHVERPSWTPPGGEGAHVVKYLGERGAVERLPGGHRDVVGSTVPLRVDDGSGLAPVSLALRRVGGVYVPANPLVPVAISSQAAGGVVFSSGVSVRPAAVSGAEPGVVVGNQLVFANAERDTDLMIEPLITGAEVSWQLRSPESPSSNSLVFALAKGVLLRSSAEMPGGAEVVEEGEPILVIPPAVAQAADGKALATSYTISGDALTTHVDLSGPVDFPVLVDPVLIGFYGEKESADVWSGWHHYSNCECFGFPEYPALIQAGANPGPANGDYGEWYVTAPGAGQPGGAGITRVDLTGVTHQALAQSAVQAEITNSNGAKPVYTFNVNNWKEELPQPLATDEVLSSKAITFCAESAGETNEPESLCDEIHDQGESFLITDSLGPEPRSVYNYVQLTGARVIYRDVTPPNEVSVSGFNEEWTQHGPTAHIYAHDQGLGIQRFELRIPPEAEPKGKAFYEQENSCNVGKGFTGCPQSETSAGITFASLATGVWSAGGYAVDAAGNREEARTSQKLYIDHTAPVIGALSGSLAAASGKVIGAGQYTLSMSAEDGSHAAPQAGVRTLEVEVDGSGRYLKSSSCGQPKGVPAEGCFALSGSWTMDGEKYGTGLHTIKVLATDWAGNVSETSFVVSINEAPYQSMGPGGVNVQTGDFKLTATDVSISGGAAGLQVDRTYDSRELAQGVEGPLGPEWSLSLGAIWHSLTPLPSGGVAVFAAHGRQIVFTPKEGGGYVSPAGYQTYTLTKVTGSEAFLITDAAGDYTRFTQPASGSVFVPTSTAQASSAGGLNKVSYSFTKTAQGIIEPTEVIGPEPTQGACAPTLVKGCRALMFSYGTSTKASGEAPGQWGEYKERLVTISFTAWEPVKGEMRTLPVAEYAYDAQGRLRAEWNPQLTPQPLKASYGYGPESLITAVDTPGQQPWLINYGTSEGDVNRGRLLSVASPSAVTALASGSAPENTAAPTLSSTSPTLGTKLSVTEGAWGNAALDYSYQWEDCNSSGVQCAPIAGATNQSYTPLLSDAGHTLVAQVFAANADGTTTAATAASAVIALSEDSFNFGSAGNKEGQVEEPWGVAVNQVTGNVYVVSSKAGRVEEFNAKGEFVAWVGAPGSGNGQMQSPESIALDSSGDIFVGDKGNSRVDEFNSKGEYVTKFGASGKGNGQFGGAIGGVAVDPNGTLYAVDTADARVEEFKASNGEYTGQFGKEGSGLGEFVAPTAIADVETSPGQRYLYVANTGGHDVERLSLIGNWTQTIGGSSKEAGELQAPEGIALNTASSEIYITDHTNGVVKEYTEAGGFVTSLGSKGSGASQFNNPLGAATLTSGATTSLYVVDAGNSRVDVWNVSEPTSEPIQTPPNPGSNDVTTIEYHVPVSGASAPYQMDKTTIAGWGQTKDTPGEATAVFPGDEPEGWPAQDYKRASIIYLDSESHPVNTITPSGAIATTEYNQTNNNVERTLSPDNRLAALKEGSKSAEASKLLDTQDIYSSDGTELIETLGPQHLVKLSSGSQVSSRKLTSYSYDENAPEGGTYHLVTTTSEGSWIAGQNVEDKRTVKTSYGGQENLGWKLHAPTSSSTSDGSVNLVSTTKYESATGNVTETQTPASTRSENIPPAYLSKFGSTGSEPGQLKEPKATALTSTGNVLVLDGGNSRVEEYSATGTYLAKFGELGLGNGQLKIPAAMAVEGKGNVLVADTGNNRGEEFNAKGEYQLQFGKEGTAGGQFKEPKGIAVGKAGVIFVVDTGNSRIEKFNEKGEFLETFGFGVAFGNNGMEVCKTSCRAGISGSGNGQLSEPRGIVVSAGDVFVADAGNNRVEVYTEAGAWVRTIGSSGSGNGQLSSPKGVTTDAAGNVIVTDTGNGRLEKFTPTGGFIWAAASKGTGTGQFEEPWGPSVTATGSIYVADLKNNRVQQWTPTMTGNAGAHDTQTIYYTAAPNQSYRACGEHPEWASLPCQAQPAAQPGTAGLPNLPVTTYPSYNIWNEPLTIIDTVGSTTRTTTITYDAAGRTHTTAISSSIDTPLPTVTNEYSEMTGALIKQSTTTEGHTKTINSIENTLGQLTSYTDADENTTSYEYEKEKDFRLLKVNDGKGTQTYSYDPTTGLPSSLKDSAAGTFTAARDAEGNITSEGYPNGMSANYTLNPVGEPVNLEYEKTTHCTSSCIWFSDSVIPSIHGQWLSQTSSLSKQSYAYNEPGSLTEVQDTPKGEGCTTRLYNLDEDGNRTSLTTRAPGSEGKCASEGGTTQSTFVDTADRLVDPGVSYETFGNITSLPAADAGGSVLTSSFYVNNKTASLTQNGQTISYNLDPAGRTRETVYTGTVKQTTINHYAGPGASPAWTSTGANWTRNIAGIGGGLAAIQNNTGTTLELANLHGDIIATASLSETETKLLSTSDTTEYGVPRAAHPAKYSWLGAGQIPTEELESAAVNMGARTYIPQLGRFEQADPQPGGSINAYAYTFDDPINQADPSGNWTTTITYNPEAIATGEGSTLTTGGDIAPGAIMPPPVNMQAEEEFAAYPPWDAATVYAEESEFNGDAYGIFTTRMIGNTAGQKIQQPIARTRSTPTPKYTPAPRPAPAPAPSSGHSPTSGPSMGATGPCRSGGTRNSHGQCQPGHPHEHSDFCEATVVMVASPAMWTVGGWVGAGLGMVFCTIAHATGQ